ncbi:hypothetical protein BATDEDRAFT_88961 [Batrachochytrium dendrobatidis JAM81]|uniref:Aminotransferase class I/classII large domain-containing protein n=1 Tax=Batrachochytrium dendrobatidis (strain JAM81 / FGSC 10211) TaxID=684364 RepID=F4P2M2_BATDJ|nr:uncharacterized protein BATDEDRAFT_88961 [Batrachochytrium dendrobatidis JAM81]EGF80236.1 hypothetical protein BATDEDRAFT_88961 [Batrachochytrium dendrobatidis JAM81]|eukprot:XP_006679216.1 hypothetical protein BATDEDRAFT_88961 [Batrachochytrium dendrobatidis JAM81]
MDSTESVGPCWSLADTMQSLLDKRVRNGLLRSIALPTQLILDQHRTMVDFSSNDYMGLSHNTNLSYQINQILINNNNLIQSQSTSVSQQLPQVARIGSTGSRLLAGNSVDAVSLENMLVSHYTSKSTNDVASSNFKSPYKALLFNSGYDANLSLFSAIPQSNVLVLYDELIHASVHDGLRLRRFGKIKSFKHNDIINVKNILDAFFTEEASDTDMSNRCAVIAVEAVYSMDGDVAPLLELAKISKMYKGKVNLIIDEAHSTGVIGERGAGLVHDLDIEDAVFARLHTFGKGMGSHGAVVIGSSTLIEFLVNFGRPLIYSTMMSFHSLVEIRTSHKFVATHWKSLQDTLKAKIVLFRNLMHSMPPGAQLLGSMTAIQGIVLPGNENVNTLAHILLSCGQSVRPIRFPTVPKGSERVRICIHVHNTDKEIKALSQDCLAALKLVLSKPAKL